MGSKALCGVDGWVGGVLPYKATELKKNNFLNLFYCCCSSL